MIDNIYLLSSMMITLNENVLHQSNSLAVYFEYFYKPQRESCLSPIYHRDLAKKKERKKKEMPAYTYIHRQ